MTARIMYVTLLLYNEVTYSVRDVRIQYGGDESMALVGDVGERAVLPWQHGTHIDTVSTMTMLESPSFLLEPF
jgi:hypothetical protein